MGSNNGFSISGDSIVEELVAKAGKKPEPKPERVLKENEVTEALLIEMLTVKPPVVAASAAKPPTVKPKGLEHVNLDELAANAQKSMEGLMVGGATDVAKAASKQIAGTKAAPTAEREV